MSLPFSTTQSGDYAERGYLVETLHWKEKMKDLFH